MVVEFTEQFEKELKKHFSKAQALSLVSKLGKTKPTDGDIVTTVANVVLKERRMNTFRFYFIFRNDQLRFMTEQELKECLIRFISLSKKNNQQDVIDRIKQDLRDFGFKM